MRAVCVCLSRQAPGGTDGMYQPSANCAYQRLVKNIRSSRQAADSPAGSGTSSPVPSAAAAAPAAAPVRADSPAAAARPKEADRTAPAPAPAPAMPPADVRLIIDKMASYVAKNGRDFEGIVMGRGEYRGIRRTLISCTSYTFYKDRFLFFWN